MISRIIIMSTMLAMLCGQSFAQEFRIGPQVGFQKARDADNGKILIGSALRIKLTDAFAIEGSINYRQEKYNGGDLTVRSWPFMATGLIYPMPIVYGVIGAGWYNTTFDFSDARGTEFERPSETRQEFGWHFGGGAELPIGGKTKLAGDIRYVFLDYDFSGIPGLGDLDSDFYVFTVGLLFGL